MSTEGTYPFIMGGVSTWCDILVTGLPGTDWQILPITAGGLRRPLRFTLPANASVVRHLDLWSDEVRPRNPFGRAHRERLSLPGELVTGFLGWNSDLGQLLDALLWCRANPSHVRVVFRSPDGWSSFLDALAAVLDERIPEAGTPPEVDLLQATELYQSLYWAAQCAAAATPEGSEAPDLLLTTAAGWCSIPLVVHRALHGTPMVLSEHGVYVRESYLAAIRRDGSASARWAATRLSRGLGRLSYANADLIAPVTQANIAWELALGADPERIRVVYNGVLVPVHTAPYPSSRRVMSLGRIDPLKDVKTLLRAAAATLERVPDAEFVHFGPVPKGNEAYAESCFALHRELQLGDRFRFMGHTDDVYGEYGRSAVALMSSISEGFPISALEAMACARPVVATAVGGITEAVAGCGFTAPPGDAEGLASGVAALLHDPALAVGLGQRARDRVVHKFGQATCLANYRSLITELTGIDAGQTAVISESDNVVGPPRPELADERSAHPDTAGTPTGPSRRTLDR